MRSAISIDVAAPPELVFRLAHDVERWPRLLPHYVAADREGPPDAEGRLLIRFIARRSILPVLGLGLPVAWRSLTWSEPEACRLRFVHRGGATNGMDVTWRIEPLGSGGGRSRVEIEHLFRPRVPGWAWLIDRAFTRPIAGRTLATAWLIDRAFTRPIAGRTLATFRVLAEALAEAPAHESGTDVPANPSS